jgi:hypothetical protein
MTHDRLGPSESDPETRRAELRCSVRGYGVIASGPPPSLPMCQASAWEQLAWRPFAPADRGRRPLGERHSKRRASTLSMRPYSFASSAVMK